MQPVRSEKRGQLDELLRGWVLAEIRAGREEHAPQMTENWTSLPVFDIAVDRVLESVHYGKHESESGAGACAAAPPERDQLTFNRSSRNVERYRRMAAEGMVDSLSGETIGVSESSEMVGIDPKLPSATFRRSSFSLSTLRQPQSPSPWQAGARSMRCHSRSRSAS